MNPKSNIYIFHGDDIGSSRKAMNLLLDQEKVNGSEVVYFDGSKIVHAELETVLTASSLFYTQVIVIEGLLSRLRSKVKDNLIKLVASYSGNNLIVLWDGKEVTKPNLTPFGKNAKITGHKTPAIIFQLLESLRPGRAKEVHDMLMNSSDSLESGFIFIMIARQISNLIVAKSGDVSKLPPFTRSRLIAQAALWEESNLTTFHEKLLKIDRAIKSGTTKLDYLSQLDILLVSSLR